MVQHTHTSRPSAASARGTLLSHHAIMSLVRPFSRRGYTVDLSASDRDRGVLIFRPVALPAEPDGRPALRCVLRLERVHRAKVRVSRTLQADDGQVATMTAEGDDPAVLLDTVERVDPDRQFHVIDAGLITRSYWAEVWGEDAPRRGLRRKKTALPRLIKAEARMGVLRLSAAETDKGRFEVSLIAERGCTLHLPMDFLAVMNWRWRPLRRQNDALWLGSLKLPLWEPHRTAELETQLDAAVEHVVETLDASPVVFHHRHRGRRWRAAFQRLLPLLYICAMVLSLTLAIKFLPRTRLVHMILSNLSILAIGAFVLLDRAYRVEIPAPPRPLTEPRWWS